MEFANAAMNRRCGLSAGRNLGLPQETVLEKIFGLRSSLNNAISLNARSSEISLQHVEVVFGSGFWSTTFGHSFLAPIPLISAEYVW